MNRTIPEEESLTVEFKSDRTLLSLTDEELDGALGFVRSENGVRFPTVVGLLILGRESALREHLPTHEVAFQVLEGTQVRVNDFYRTPLVKLFERVMEQFEVRVEEDEVQIGLFRVPVPNYDRRARKRSLSQCPHPPRLHQIGSRSHPLGRLRNYHQQPRGFC
ncbi:hypothetical protein [Microcoleus sp.]|uniref:hypothetical protein n=1 Tax=Microcoleus sp. TaxID=44472 RepID=UPI003524A6CF